MRIFHNQTDGYSKCTLCNQSYPTKAKMLRHVSRFHKAETLGCPVPRCDYKTKRKEHVRVHLDFTHKSFDEKTKNYYWEQIRSVEGNFH